MRYLPYDKEAVLKDLEKGKLSAREIGEKYSLSIGNVYTIRAVARRRGRLKGGPGVPQRIKEEAAVLTLPIRERIKDLREQDYTSSEITDILNDDGVTVRLVDVNKVMARTSYDPVARKRASARARKSG